MFTDKIFTLTDEEYKEIEQWAKSHKCTCRFPNRASRSCSGGELSLTFTPTSFGTFKKIRCICGTEYKIDNV